MSRGRADDLLDCLAHKQLDLSHFDYEPLPEDAWPVLDAFARYTDGGGAPGRAAAPSTE